MVVTADEISTPLSVACILNGLDVPFLVGTAIPYTTLSVADAHKTATVFTPSAPTEQLGIAKAASKRANWYMSVNGSPTQAIRGSIFPESGQLPQLSTINWTDIAINNDVLIAYNGITIQKVPTRDLTLVMTPDGGAIPPVVNCEINGQQSPFVLDTTAQTSNLNTALANATGIVAIIEPTSGTPVATPQGQMQQYAHFPILINGASLQNIHGRVSGDPNTLAWKDACVFWDILINDKGVSLVKKGSVILSGPTTTTTTTGTGTGISKSGIAGIFIMLIILGAIYFVAKKFVFKSKSKGIGGGIMK